MAEIQKALCPAAGSHDSQVVPDPHRAKSNVKIAEADPEQTQPRPKHVAPIEAADTAISLVTCRSE